MFVVVTGGSGSGKSAYAEERIVNSHIEKRYYIATMICADEESRKRVQRHRRMRDGKSFETVECPVNLNQILLEEHSAVLLECMSNLAANEMFSGTVPEKAEDVAERIMSGIEKLHKQSELLVVVTNEVFSDGNHHDEMTEAYLKCLGMINSQMADRADELVEVVYTIPVTYKKRREK